MDVDQKSKSFGGNQRGRIILLGDGTEVLTDSDDTEMFDRSEEDRDLESQVHKGQITGEPNTAVPEKLSDEEPAYKGVADNAAPTKKEEESKPAAKDEKA